MFMTKMLYKIFRLPVVVMPSIYEIYLLHYPMGCLHDTSIENPHTWLRVLSKPSRDGTDSLRPMS